MLMATKEKLPGRPKNFELDDVLDAYELFCDNYKIHDEYLDMDLLPIGFNTIEEFEKLLQQNTVYALKWETLYDNGNVKCKSLDGFIVFEIHNEDYSILILEANSHDKTILRNLLYEVISVANTGKFKKPIILNIPETRLDLAEQAAIVGFKMTATIRNSDTPDIFKYVYTTKK